MHELSLAEELVTQLEETARTENALGIQRVEVEIGAYSGVEPDAFTFAFLFAAEGTLAEGAGLEIRKLPVEIECRQCGATSHPDPTFLACTQCGSNQVELKGGHEFLIRSVDLQVA